MRKSKITTEERDILNNAPRVRRPAAKPQPMTLRSFTPRPKVGKRKPVKPKPGYDGNFVIGAREVPDPYEPSKKITVPANIRSDLLVLMHANKDIDDAQFLAGVHFRRLIEREGGNGAPCADWTRPYVDKSICFREPVLTQFNASLELKHVRGIVGEVNYGLLQGIVFHGYSGSEIARRDYGNEDERRAVNWSVKKSLEKLAIFWGYLSAPEHVNQKAKIVAFLNEIAVWGHAEREVEIQYAEPGKRKRA